MKLIEGGTRSMKIKPKEGYCDHLNVEVDEHQRLITCAVCGAVMDGFDYVLRWAGQERRFELECEQLKRELQTLASQRNELKKEVGYLKQKQRMTITKT